MIKPEQDSKVENHTYCCIWIEKKFAKHTTTKYNGRKYNSNKISNGSVNKDQVAWQVTTLLSEFLKQFNE